MMQEQFNTFCENIRLTKEQIEDAKKKYTGVCETLHKNYYESTYDGNTKFLFGSYKKKTNIRPPTDNQDVDVIFKMPKGEFERYDNYNGNGQSALLQKIKDILKDRYTTTDKISGWGKVVLVRFSEHNVEILPGWELEDGRFKIPNTESGGRWEYFDPKKDIEKFQDSNVKTDGLTAELSRMMKKWKREVKTLAIKSFEIENYVIEFLSEYYFSEVDYDIVVRDCFKYLNERVSSGDKSLVETALNRANKAVDYAEDENFQKATEEWQKIFGKEFPVYSGTEGSYGAGTQKFEKITVKPKPWSTI